MDGLTRRTRCISIRAPAPRCRISCVIRSARFTCARAFTICRAMWPSSARRSSKAAAMGDDAISSAKPVVAYIALGSNLGDRKANISIAIERLRQAPGIEVTKVSSLLDNPAVGGPSDSPTFLNAAAEIRTTLSPRELLDHLLQIERDLGRQRREKWGPRLIDLDIV